MKRNAGVADRFVQHDLEFHNVINGATGNPLVDVMCNAMHECMRRTMQVGILNLQGEGGSTEGRRKSITDSQLQSTRVTQSALAH